VALVGKATGESNLVQRFGCVKQMVLCAPYALLKQPLVRRDTYADLEGAGEVPWRQAAGTG
jgi:hypothetical protein